MRSWTYLEAKTKIEDNLDLHEENFISTTEMLGFFNEAIDDIEALIHTLYEDYFLVVDAPIALVSGTSLYALPDDIYASKIRLFRYTNGAQKYEIKPIKRLKLIDNIVAEDDYQYI